MAPADPPAFPWEQVMGLGLGVLRLSPHAFWRMTPRELVCAAGLHAPRGPRPLVRAELVDLMRRFPDSMPDTGTAP